MFTVIVLNEGVTGGGTLAATAVWTIVLSVVAHGLTAGPLAAALAKHDGSPVHRVNGIGQPLTIVSGARAAPMLTIMGGIGPQWPGRRDRAAPDHAAISPAPMASELMAPAPRNRRST